MVETTVLLAVTVRAPDHFSNDEINEAVSQGAGPVVVVESKPLSVKPGVYICCPRCGSLRSTRRSTRAGRSPLGECCA